MARYAIIDTETTGLDPQKNQTLEVGVIICDEDLKIVSYDNFLVKHKEYVISPRAMEINGIDLVEHNKQADDAKIACNKIVKFLNDNALDGERYVFAGQNCTFDRGFLNELFDNNASDEDRQAWRSVMGYHNLELQTLAMAANIKGEININSFNLDTISNALNIVPQNVEIEGVESYRHRALYDCLLELNCMQSLLNKPLSQLEKESTSTDGVEISNGRYAYSYEITGLSEPCANLDLHSAVGDFSRWCQEDGEYDLLMNVTDWQNGRKGKVYIAHSDNSKLSKISLNDEQLVEYMEDKAFKDSFESDYKLIELIPDVEDKLRDFNKRSHVINLFGGAGAGKSTSAMELTALLKKNGFVAEYVPEYAKELVWAGDMVMLDGSKEHQTDILIEQTKRLNRLKGKVDYIVTDSPIILNGVYMTEGTVSEQNEYRKHVIDMFKAEGKQINLFVNRGDKPFEQTGRIHTFEQSVAIDKDIKTLLNDNDIPFTEIERDGGVKAIVDNIVKQREEANKVKATLTREWVEENYDIDGEIDYIEIPEGFKYIAEGAFRSVDVKHIKLPNSLETIGRYAFSGSGVDIIENTEHLKTIGEGAFKSSNVETFDFPEGIKIGNSAFEGTFLKNVSLNGARLGSKAFAFSSVSSVTLSNMRSISEECFMACDQLTEVKEIYNDTQLEDIGIAAFNGCEQLKRIDLGGVRTIGSEAFRDCKSLNEIDLRKCGTIHSYAFSGSGLETLDLSGAKYVTNNAFENCNNLETVKIGDKIDAIYPNTFRNCHSLTSVSMGDNVRTFGNGVFAYCDNLEHINCDKVMYMSNDAFIGCDKLPMLADRATSAHTTIMNDVAGETELHYDFYVKHKRYADDTEYRLDSCNNLSEAVDLAKKYCHGGCDTEIRCMAREYFPPNNSKIDETDVAFFEYKDGKASYPNVANDAIISRCSSLSTEYPPRIKKSFDVFNKYFFKLPSDKASLEKDFLTKNGIGFDTRDKNGMTVFAISNADKQRYDTLKAPSAQANTVQSI